MEVIKSPCNVTSQHFCSQQLLIARIMQYNLEAAHRQHLQDAKDDTSLVFLALK
jgi:hypothetical protein